MKPQDLAKRAAGAAAIDRYVEPGMKLGLGSGTTSHWMVRVLGERVQGGLDVVCAATSTGTADLARSLGIDVRELDAVGELDLTLDGADEIDHELRMIKGGGACLLWEKIVAAASRRMVAIVDASKVVDRLGAFPLPVEVIAMGWRSTARLVERCLARHGLDGRQVTLRGGEASPVLTDSRNLILDCHLGSIPDPEALEADLNRIPGVVENGLFCGFAEAMVIGHPDGSTEVLNRG